jgi:hypothetical protein
MTSGSILRLEWPRVPNPKPFRLREQGFAIESFEYDEQFPIPFAARNLADLAFGRLENFLCGDILPR